MLPRIVNSVYHPLNRPAPTYVHARGRAASRRQHSGVARHPLLAVCSEIIKHKIDPPAARELTLFDQMPYAHGRASDRELEGRRLHGVPSKDPFLMLVRVGIRQSGPY
jgi:hypothetical protein